MGSISKVKKIWTGMCSLYVKLDSTLDYFHQDCLFCRINFFQKYEYMPIIIDVNAYFKQNMNLFVFLSYWYGYIYQLVNHFWNTDYQITCWTDGLKFVVYSHLHVSASVDRVSFWHQSERESMYRKKYIKTCTSSYWLLWISRVEWQLYHLYK